MLRAGPATGHPIHAPAVRATATRNLLITGKALPATYSGTDRGELMQSITLGDVTVTRDGDSFRITRWS
jgi:hypothetical protein